MNETLINSLRIAFNFNEYEAKIMTALYLKGKQGVVQLFKISTVPRSRIYDICEKLKADGFLVEHPREKVSIKKEKRRKFSPKNSYYVERVLPTRYEAIKFNDLVINIEKNLNKKVEDQMKLIKMNMPMIKEQLRLMK